MRNFAIRADLRSDRTAARNCRVRRAATRRDRAGGAFFSGGATADERLRRYLRHPQL
jgi:hypothetical protein